MTNKEQSSRTKKNYKNIGHSANLKNEFQASVSHQSQEENIELIKDK